MSVRKHHVSAAGPPPRIEVRNPAGSVCIEAVEGADELEVRVEALDATAEELLDGVVIDVAAGDPDRVDSPTRLRVTVPERRLLRSPAFAVRITTPPGASARIAVASADVELQGRLGRLELTAASGDIAVDSCADLQLRSASGGVRIGTATGRATIGTASGDVRVARVEGDLELRTASGDVSVDETLGSVSVRTASGNVAIGAAGTGDIELKTVSGDAMVGVVPGLRVWLDLSTISGRMNSVLDPEDAPGGDPAELSITMRSVSGDLRIRRAPGHAPPAAA
jgi:hypothetical protein